MVAPKYDRDFLVSRGLNSVVRVPVTKTSTEPVIFQVLGGANAISQIMKGNFKSTRSFIIARKHVKKVKGLCLGVRRFLTKEVCKSLE